MNADPEIVRTRTTHGWAFTDLSPEEVNRVKAYLADGDPRHLDGTNYAELRRGVLKRLTPADRRRHKLPPAPAPEPAAPAVETVTVEVPPGAKLEMHRSDQAKFVLIVAEDGKVTMGGTAGPDEALAIVHAVLHAMVDADKAARGDLN